MVSIVVSVLLLFLVLYMPTRTIITDNFLALEREEVLQNATRLQLLVHNQYRDLERIVRDYGWWDDTYAYMVQRNASYLDNYGLETLLNNDVDIVVLFDKNGQMMFGTMVSSQGDALLPLDVTLIETLTLASKTVWGLSLPDAVSDIVVAGEGRYILLAATPILDTYRKGPSPGILLMGRYLDASLLDDFSALLGYQVSLAEPPIHSVDNVVFQFLNGHELTAELLLRAGDSNPVVALAWTQPRRIYQQGQQMLLLHGITLGMGGIFVGGLLLILIELVLTQRLNTLAQDAEGIARSGREGNFSLRLTASGEDEVARMAGNINAMLDTLEATQKELLDQKLLLENLIQVARTVVEGLDLNVTLENALKISFSLTNARQGSLMLLDESLQVQHVLILREDKIFQESSALAQVFVDRGLAGWVARHALPACITEVALDPRWVVRGDPGAPPQTGSALAVPVLGSGRVLGVLTLTHPQPGHFTPAHVLMLQAAVEQIALAIRNSRLYEEQRRLAQRQTVLYEMLRAISSIMDRDMLLQTTLATLRRLTHWDRISFWFPDDSLQSLMRIVSTDSTDGSVTLSVTEGIVGRAFRERKSQSVTDVLNDADYRVMDPAVRSQLCVPLRRGERVLGVLDLESDQKDGFAPDDVILAESIAETLALALENVYSYQDMRRYLSNLNILFALARMTSQSMKLDELLNQALYTVINSMGFDFGVILLRRPESGGFVLEADYALPAELKTAWKQGADEGWWQFLFDRMQPLMIGDLERTDLPFIARLKSAWPMTLGRLNRARLRSFAAIPLAHQQQVQGILMLLSAQPRIFYSEDVSLLTMLGQQLASVVSNVRLFTAVTEERGRLSALIAAERDGVLFILRDGRLSLANPAVLQLLQQITESDVPSSLDRLLLTIEQSLPELAQILHQAPERQTGEGELTLGRYFVRWMLYPVRGEENTLLGWLLVLRDLTETRRLEMLRDDMTHAMVHDLRNPLTAIMGSVKLLERGLREAPENIQQLLRIVRSSTDRMLGLVTAILDLARLEEGRMPVKLQPIALPPFLDGLLPSFQVLAERKQIALTTVCPADLPEVSADPDLLRRVLENLLNNALKFTPEGGQVKIVGRYLPDLQRVQLEVHDTGPGVPETLRGRLFQKFASGDQIGRGSGLGLAFCRMVMEAHGETIWLEDTGPQGTVFALTLSVWKDPAISGPLAKKMGQTA